MIDLVGYVVVGLLCFGAGICFAAGILILGLRGDIDRFLRWMNGRTYGD